MIIDQNKLNRQLLIKDRWWGVGAVGAFEAHTGFGKTYTILLMIQAMLHRYPNYRTTVIVPSTPLKAMWEEKVANMGLANVTVYVVNTYVRFEDGDPRLETELLAADELHHYCSVKAQFFNTVMPRTKYKYFIGASATLERVEIDFLSSCGIPLFDKVTEAECEANGWTAKSIVYNLELPFTEEDRKYSKGLDNVFKANFARFEHNFDLMMACSGGSKKNFRVEIQGEVYYKTGPDWRDWWASVMGWSLALGDEHDWSPKNIVRYAVNGTRAMKERKTFLYNLPSKLPKVLELLERYSDKKVIVFCESSAAADALEALKPEFIKSYHSDLDTLIIDGKKLGAKRRRDLIIKQFEDKNHPCRVLACVKALDEGFDVDTIDFAIVHSYTSVKRRDVQRRGRAARIDYDNLDKVSLVVNFYMENSQEFKWLKSKQKGTRKAIWVKSINEIALEQPALL